MACGSGRRMKVTPFYWRDRQVGFLRIGQVLRLFPPWIVHLGSGWRVWTVPPQRTWLPFHPGVCRRFSGGNNILAALPRSEERGAALRRWLESLVGTTASRARLPGVRHVDNCLLSLGLKKSGSLPFFS